MPSLALFVACERSIIEENTKLVSLISLLNGVKGAIPAGEPPPRNAVAPKEWSIVCGWDAVGDEEGTEYVQCLDIFWPDGKPFVETNKVKFSLQKGKRHYQTSRLHGFPVGQAGRCLMQAWAEQDGNPVTEKVSLYITVEHEFTATPL